MMQQTIIVRALARISCGWSVLNVILKLRISLLFSLFLQVIYSIVKYNSHSQFWFSSILETF